MTRTTEPSWSAVALMLCLTCPASSAVRTDPPGALAPPLALLPHDCNGNGVEDAVDIARGTSSDADLDGVPDECQGARRTSTGPAGRGADAADGPDDDGTSPAVQGS